MRLNIREASFGYKEKDIFEEVNFNIDSGEIFCLLGPNGCGKSTLLECILGINSLSSGNIYLDTVEIKNFKGHRLASKIAYVQQVQTKTFPYRVIDVVLMGRAVYTNMFSAPSQEDIEVAWKALNLVGLKRLGELPYTNLSGGETQLVMIARALAQETPFIIMDEPTSHLDFRFELIVLQTIVRLAKENNISIIIATHSPNHAFYFENTGVPTRVALMDRKKINLIGKPSKVLTEDNMKIVFNVTVKIASQIIDGREVKQIIPLSVI